MSRVPGLRIAVLTARIAFHRPYKTVGKREGKEKQGHYRGRVRARRKETCQHQRLRGTMLSTAGVADSYPTHFFFYGRYCVTVLYRMLFGQIGAALLGGRTTRRQTISARGI